MEERKPVALTDVIGQCGKYQTVMYILSFYSSWFIGTAIVTVELLAPIVTIYWNWDADKANKTTFSSVDCKMETINKLNEAKNKTNSSLIYFSPYSKRTLTEELGMVCEKSWLISFANFLSILGLCAGNIFLRCTEIYGRRPFIIASGIGCAVLSVCVAFSKNYAMFAVFTFLFRAFVNQGYALTFMQAVELSTPARSPYLGLVTKTGLLFAQTLFVGAAWILENWFYTQLFQAFLAFWYLVLVWYVLESPIWLAVRGRYEESREVLVKIVQRNGRNPKDVEEKINSWLEQMKRRCETEAKAEKGKFRDLFQNKYIALYTLGITFIALSGIFVFSGMVMNAESFASDLYVDLTLSNAFSLLPVILAGFLLRRVSIRMMLCFSFLFEGLTCIAYPITYHSQLARTIISVLGRIFIAPIFAVSFLYANDVYPTSVRAVGTGTTGFIAFLISTLSPFTKELGEWTAMYVPFILFAALSLGSSLVLTQLPETKDQPMIHTIHELKLRRKTKNCEKPPVYTITTKC